ncbi:hypothetical protein GBAR_LOCUS442 [Geodia barretti]|nr:hypothetical protein GBAR_LOCUS442 [Geodia barretti]
MKGRARRVLLADLAKIKESKFDPVWLAEELFAAGIVGEEERVAAKDETVSKEHRRDELLDLVMGNGGESVFQTFVNIFSSKRHMHWLAMDLKDEFLRQGGVWMKEEPVRISDDIPEPGAVTQTITPAGDSLVVLDKRLNKDDAVDIVRQLLDVQNKAKTLGRLLKLPRAIIEVTPQLTGDPQAPLFYIIDEFLKQVDPRPTWRLILNALRDPLIGEHSLAQEIEMSLTTDITSPSLPAASLSQSSFPTSVPNSTSPTDVLQSTTAAAAPLPALTADSQSLSVSQSISTVSVSRSKLPGTGSSSPGDSTQWTKRDSRPTHQAVRHRSQEMAKPAQTHFRALSPASTSVVHKSRSRGPSSGSLTKKVHYSTKGTASQKLTAVVAKPQPSGHRSQEKATLGAVGGHSSMAETQHSTKHKNTSGQQSSSVVSRTTHGIKAVSASRTRKVEALQFFLIFTHCSRSHCIRHATVCDLQ